MKQITEDYVSFEVAKLLKEKGFDEPVNRFYEISTGEPSLVRSEYCRNSFTTSYAAPTHQMAMKWLREVHNIVIEVNMEDYMTTASGSLSITYSYTIWHFNRHLDEVGEIDIRFTDEAIWGKEGATYGEVAESAIKYCLENLI